MGTCMTAGRRAEKACRAHLSLANMPFTSRIWRRSQSAADMVATDAAFPWTVGRSTMSGATSLGTVALHSGRCQRSAPEGSTADTWPSPETRRKPPGMAAKRRMECGASEGATSPGMESTSGPSMTAVTGGARWSDVARAPREGAHGHEHVKMAGQHD